MKRTLTFGLAALAVHVALALAPAPYANPVPPAPDEDMENPRYLLAGQADEAIAAGDYDAAAARLIEAISISPDDPSNALLLSNLGMVYSCQDRDSLALATLDEALRRAPAMTTVHANRARVLLKMGRDAEAYGAYGRVLQSDSLNNEARFYHGMIALYSGDAATAGADFGVLRDRDPMGLPTARAMAALLSLTGRNAEAVPYFKRILTEEPQPEYYAALTGCYLAEGDLTEASATLGDALVRFPDDPELLYYRAWLRRDQFRLDEARADARRAVELGFPRRRAEELFNNRTRP